MSLFKKEPPPPPPETGIMLLRRTVKARDHKAGALHAIVREIPGLSISALEDFANGRAELPRPLLQALAKEIYGAGLDDDDMLYQLNPPPVSTIGIVPPRFDPDKCPTVYRHDPNKSRIGPQPVKPSEAKTTTRRAGWRDPGFARPVETPVVREKPPQRAPFVRLPNDY
jgi:hypothetical protein